MDAIINISVNVIPNIIINIIANTNVRVRVNIIASININPTNIDIIIKNLAMKKSAAPQQGWPTSCPAAGGGCSVAAVIV